jgi:hypothetical protein
MFSLTSNEFVVALFLEAVGSVLFTFFTTVLSLILGLPS